MIELLSTLGQQYGSEIITCITTTLIAYFKMLSDKRRLRRSGELMDNKYFETHIRK